VKIETKKYNDFYVQPKTHHLLLISTELSFQVVLMARIGEKLSEGIKPTWFKNTLYLAPGTLVPKGCHHVKGSHHL
jgi:hypothetical protein